MAVAVFLHCWSGGIDEGSNQEDRMIGRMVFNLVGASAAAAA
jgi:hypothetical protein